MKKISLLVLSAAVAVSGFFSSCSKDDETTPGPSVSFDNSVITASVASGASYTINGTARAAGELKKIQFYTVTGTTESEIANSAISSFSVDTIQHFSLSVSNVTATVAVKVLVTDKNDLTASSTFTITVTSVATTKVLSYSTVLVGAVGNSGTDNATAGSAFASTNGNVYFKTAAATNSSLVDFIYYYNASPNFASLYSPDALNTSGSAYVSNFGTLNATTFVKVASSALTTAQFDAISSTDDSAITTNAVSLSVGKIFALATGDIIAFKTVPGKLGLIKVGAITTGVTGTITLDVKVQK